MRFSAPDTGLLLLALLRLRHDLVMIGRAAFRPCPRPCMLVSTRSPMLRQPSAIFSARAGPRSLLAASLPGSIAWNRRSTPMRRQSP